MRTFRGGILTYLNAKVRLSIINHRLNLYFGIRPNVAAQQSLKVVESSGRPVRREVTLAESISKRSLYQCQLCLQDNQTKDSQIISVDYSQSIGSYAYCATLSKFVVLSCI